MYVTSFSGIPYYSNMRLISKMYLEYLEQNSCSITLDISMLQQTSVPQSPQTFFISIHTVQTKYHANFFTSMLSSLILLCNLFSNLILAAE